MDQRALIYTGGPDTSARPFGAIDGPLPSLAETSGGDTRGLVRNGGQRGAFPASTACASVRDDGLADVGAGFKRLCPSSQPK